MTGIPDNAVMPEPPSWTLREPEDEYHARSKSGEIMSSGMLKKFRDCPLAYHRTVTGEMAEKTSDAFRFGRAVHKLILEGRDAFDREFAVGGPINERTGKSYAVGTKAHDEWLAANGYAREQVINDAEADALGRMAGMVRNHSVAAAYLEFGWPELVVRADLHGVPCQIRMDWLTCDAQGNHVIIDIKTTEDMTWFESDARRYGYPHQFAFYRDVFQTTGVAVQVAVIVVEKKEPFRVSVWHMPVEVLDYHSAENRDALEHFKYCRQHDEWPTGYEAVREFGLPRDTIGG